MKFLNWFFIFLILMSFSLVLAEKTGSYSDYLSISKNSNGVIVVEGKGSSGSYCGDGSLQLTEGEQCEGTDLGGQTCISLGYDGGSLSCKDNCVYDTSLCYSDTTDTSSSSSGSGKHTSSSSDSGLGSKKCVESWNCTEWSECSDDFQTRTCTDSKSCGTTVNKPVEERQCEMGFTYGDSTSDQKKKLSGITGAVIGALGSYSLWLIIVLLIVVIAAFVYVSKRKKVGAKGKALNFKIKKK